VRGVAGEEDAAVAVAVDHLPAQHPGPDRQDLDGQLVRSERAPHTGEAPLGGEVLRALAVLGKVRRVEAVAAPVAAERDEGARGFWRRRPEQRLVALVDETLEVGLEVDVDHVAEGWRADERSAEGLPGTAPHALAGDGVGRLDLKLLARRAVDDRRPHALGVLLDRDLLVVEEDGGVAAPLGVALEDRLEDDL
jgi:hypothetical protein